MRLLLLFYPWLELLSLIQLGIETRAIVPLLWVLAMFMVGAALLKRVGTASVLRLREAQQSGVLQQSLFLDDLAVAVAALLLMIPGLLSDFFAVVVLIGPLRRLLARIFLGKVVSQADASGWYASSSMPDDDSKFQSSEILEGDYQDISPGVGRPNVIDTSENDTQRDQ
jgi:UPF0716 protein FxsA